MPSEWNYGDAYRRHPIKDGQTVTFDDGSAVKVHDIFDLLPDFMRRADLVFVDPPWNLGNLNSFYTKAAKEERQGDFQKFYKRLFECIAQIMPKTCYVEVGKEYLGEFLMEMKGMYDSVTLYNSSYYHKRENICYVVRGSWKRKKMNFDFLDEEDIISAICETEEYSCIGDLCIGRGLVAMAARRNGKKFVGTELNRKRLSVLLERLSKMGATYQ